MGSSSSIQYGREWRDSALRGANFRIYVVVESTKIGSKTRLALCRLPIMSSSH